MFKVKKSLRFFLYKTPLIIYTAQHNPPTTYLPPTPTYPPPNLPRPTPTPSLHLATPNYPSTIQLPTYLPTHLSTTPTPPPTYPPPHLTPHLPLPPNYPLSSSNYLHLPNVSIHPLHLAPSAPKKLSAFLKHFNVVC